jgi:hypothetical protein
VKRAWLALSALLLAACGDGPSGVACSSANAGDTCASPGEHCTEDAACPHTKTCNERLVWSFGCYVAPGAPCNGKCGR